MLQVTQTPLTTMMPMITKVAVHEDDACYDDADGYEWDYNNDDAFSIMM